MNRERKMIRVMTRTHQRVTGNLKQILFLRNESPGQEDSVRGRLSSKNLRAKKIIWTVFLQNSSKLRYYNLKLRKNLTFKIISIFGIRLQNLAS